MHDLKRISFAVDVDENSVKIDMGTDFGQAKVVLIDRLMGIKARAADMGRANELACRGVAPRMVGATDRAFNLLGL